MKQKITGLILLLIILISGRTDLKGQKGDATISENRRYYDYCFQNVLVKKDIPFGKVVNHEGKKEGLKLDIYTPENDQKSNLRVIVWFHGGGFKPGNDKSQSYIVSLCHAFARKGYICVAPDYRLRTNPESDMKGTLDDAIQDVEMALKWIRKNCKQYNIDKRYVIVGGGSAGGILMSNFCFGNNNVGKTWNIRAFINLWGSPDNLLSNPLQYNQSPSTIFIHGNNDIVVPYMNSESLASCLSKAGVYNELHPLLGASHTPVDRMDEIISLITSFLNHPEIENTTGK